MAFRVSSRLAAGVAAGALALALSACNAWQNRAEFAAPQDRWNESEPSPVRVDAKPPPIAEQYCYRTLAQVDCFAAAQPDRITGYTGLYPDPDSLPPTPKAKN